MCNIMCGLFLFLLTTIVFGIAETEILRLELGINMHVLRVVLHAYALSVQNYTVRGSCATVLPSDRNRFCICPQQVGSAVPAGWKRRGNLSTLCGCQYCEKAAPFFFPFSCKYFAIGLLVSRMKILCFKSSDGVPLRTETGDSGAFQKSKCQFHIPGRRRCTEGRRIFFEVYVPIVRIFGEKSYFYSSKDRCDARNGKGMRR